MVYNEATPTFCVHGQYFKKGYVIVVSYIRHDLVLRKVNGLIII
jgi:hypothetical protein